MYKNLPFDPQILRTYDIRGIVGEQFNHHHAYLIGQGYGTFLKQKGAHTIVVGYDGRLTSPLLEKALIEGLMHTGLEITRIGVGPSPLAYFAHFSLPSSDACIMVTGSHNPAAHNGFKIMWKQKPFYGDQIQALGALIERNDFVQQKQGTVQFINIHSSYLNYLHQDFAKYYSNARPLKVIWDAANGAVGEILQKLVLKLPGEHILLNEKIDGTFPAHHPDPAVEENLMQLKTAVKDHQADLGFSFDGDGDRVGVVDNTGKIIWSDQLLILLAGDLLKTYPDSIIIGDVKCSDIAFQEIKKQGGMPLMWRTGHSMIKAKMAETGAKLAGEMSGHLFFADRHYGFDDALYAALRILGVVATMQESLGQWYDRLPKLLSTPEIRIEIKGKDKFEIVAKIQQALRDQGADFNDLDGIRVTDSYGWWIVRASHTSEALSIRAEAETEEGLEVLKKNLRRYLKEGGLTEGDLLDSI